MIRLLVLLLLISCCFSSTAQQLRGIVIDRITNLPIANASIASSFVAAISSESGRFRLISARAGDTITVTCKGYKTTTTVLGLARPDSLRIYLVQNSILLGDVKVVGLSSYKQDSIRLRDEFKAAFQYKPLTVKDIFVKKPESLSSTPQPYNKVVNGTAAIVTLDVLRIVKLLVPKKRDKSAALKKALLQEEVDRYVDQTFTKARITAVTPLKGDSLRDFTVLYRPSVRALKKMEAADLNLYIMDSYRLFLKTYRPGGLLRLAPQK